jgi:hypothetical protein
MKKISILKNELKELASKIKISKIECKQCQREHGGCDGYSTGSMADGTFKWHGGYFSIISKLKKEFRHKHITYCLLRGRERNEIEVPAKNHQPDETLIKEILREYTEDNVCVNA